MDVVNFNEVTHNFPTLEIKDNGEQYMYYQVMEKTNLKNNLEFLSTCDDSAGIITEESENETCTEMKKEYIHHVPNEIRNIIQHSLILTKNNNEYGQFVDTYSCEKCEVEFDTLSEFVNAHPGIPIEELFPKQLSHLLNFEDNTNYLQLHIEQNRGLITKEVNQLNDDADPDANKFICYVCENVFDSYNDAEKHDCNMYAPENEVFCTIVDKFGSIDPLDRHSKRPPKPVSNSNIESSIICELCNTTFFSVKSLKLHMKLHISPPKRTIQEALPPNVVNEYKIYHQFYCEICEKSFDENLLNVHRNMHKKLQEYRCGKCNRQFDNAASFKIHMQMHKEYPKIMKPYKELFEKAEIGVMQKTFPCQFCGKVFTRPYEKVKHERVHTGEKPYECEVCGKTFRVSYSLTLHLRTHTDIRPYICAICNKRYKSQSVYVHHLKTHGTDRQYKCDICEKTFRTSVQLCGHKNSHKKPYICATCNRPFASMYAVKMHMKLHNEIPKSKSGISHCSICGATYARLNAFYAHYKEAHGQDIQLKQNGNDKNKSIKKRKKNF